MRPSIALFSFAAVLVSAQAQNYTSELDMTINPGTVPQADRASWCRAQTDTCTILCDKKASENECDLNDLSWACKCSSNSSAPGIQYYTQTVPTFICNELFSQCITANTNSADGQEACKENILALCGTANPASFSGSSTSTTAKTSAAAATNSGSGSSATGGSVTTTSSNGLAAPTMMPGAAAIAIGVLAYLA